MKKVLFGTSLLIALFSTASVFANDFAGSRAGVGLSKTSVVFEYEGEDIWEGDLGNGFKIEYGYDFNQIIGVAISYETFDDSISDGEIEGSAFKVGTDIGYAFPIQEAFLKPYGKLGFVSYSETYSEDNYESDFDDKSVFIGLGLRFQYSHFYTDLSVDFYTLDNGTLDQKMTQTALTAGYKF